MEGIIIGLGSRGRLYTDILHNRNIKIKAVADFYEDRRNLAKEKYGVEESMIFDNADDLLKLGKIADFAVIATMDADHYHQAMQAIELGYHLILEKPVCITAQECKNLAEAATAKGVKVIVCHVLRYTPFYNKIKEVVDSGVIGRIISISQTENVGYWHQAHSFVRGNWADTKKTTPMILAKCCHDMDIIRWLMDKSCVSVSSFGSLSYFTRENAPVGSAERCVDCKVDCPYNALTFYGNPVRKGWLAMFSHGNPNAEEVLKTSPYGRYAFRCDNDAVDHQVVNMLFEGGETAQLTMTAFAYYPHRRLHIHGTLGDIEGVMEEGVIHINIYGQNPQSIDIKQIADDLSGHCGGDWRMVEDFISALEGKTSRSLTDIKVSVESHLMSFAAEESRLNGGIPVQI